MEHPDIETPPDEVGIWRYMTLESFLFLMTRSRLYFCRADKFQDPWEGVWPKPIVRALRSQEFAQSYKGKDLGETILRWSENYRKSVFINCWCKNSHESAAMWSIYDGRGTSVAITSTIGRLKRAILDRDFYIGNVQYIDYRDGTIPTLNMLLPFFTKRKSFEHEQELRVLINELPLTGKKVDWAKASEEILARADLRTLIDTVYVSPSAALWVKDVVGELLAKFQVAEAKVHQSRLYEAHVY